MLANVMYALALSLLIVFSALLYRYCAPTSIKNRLGIRANLECIYFRVTRNSRAYNNKLDHSFKFPKTMAHAGGGARGVKYSNSRESLDINYKKGFRLFEVDVNCTSDAHLVLLHDWGDTVSRLFCVAPKIYSLEEFKMLKNDKGLTQLTLDELVEWMSQHDDACFMLDGKKDPVAIYRTISESYPGIIHRIMPEIWRFGEYFTVMDMGYNKIIFEAGVYNDRAFTLFLEDYKVTAVSLSIRAGFSTLPRALKKIGVISYVYAVNNAEIAERLFENGVDGISTDFLPPVQS